MTTLTDTLDAALRPYLPGDARRRFVAERVAPVVAEEFLRRLDVALGAIASCAESDSEALAGVLTHARAVKRSTDHLAVSTGLSRGDAP